MQSELKYNGYAAKPSDYEVPDGGLGVMMNLFPKDGALKPVVPAKSKFYVYSPSRLLYVHETSAFKHYIFYNSTSTYLWFVDDDTDFDSAWSGTNIASITQTIYQVNAIGNTLVVLTEAGIYHYLWDADNSTYKVLGMDMPEFKLSFGLQARIKKSDSFSVTFAGSTETSEYDNSTEIPTVDEDSGVSTLTEAVLARVNRIINEEVLGSERFCMPFFVRYAYRLYDGSLTRQSPPILMLPTNGISPRVYCAGYSVSGSNVTATLRAYAPAAKLDMAALTAPSVLTDWADIIKSIDIFISAPIYSYDQSGECTEFGLTAEDKSYGIFMMDNLDDKYDDATLLSTLKKYSEWSITDAIRVEEGDYYARVLKLPTKGEGVINSEIANCSSFYFLKSIPIDELSQTRSLLEIDEGYLNALTSRETLPDDYDSHDVIVANNSFTYNARLVLSGIKKHMFDGYFGHCYAETVIGGLTFSGRATAASTYDCYVADKVYVYIKRDGRDIIVEEQPDILLSTKDQTNVTVSPVVQYFYHPDPNAYKAVIVHNSTNYDRNITLPLKTHEHLAGSFFFDGFANQTIRQATSGSIVASTDKTVAFYNKIYLSEINNPFYFPLLGIVTVGTSDIIGVSTAAKALSQGQFGQFPLYAFTKEGVWSLEISSTGTISARQPITRDVCINANSITQIDSAVLFATDRGIMLISGSQTQCITDPIDTDTPDLLAELSFGSELAEMFTDGLPSTMYVTGDAPFAYVPFKTFLQTCRISYDYTHQRLFLFSPSYSYAYVYSFETKTWGMAYSDYDYPVNSYPDAFVMTREYVADGETVTYSGRYLCNFCTLRPDYSIELPVLFVTRPLKLNAPDVLKTINTVIQRGFFRKGQFKQVLYGSRDLINWFPIYSSTDEYLRGFRGTPYKYFKIAVFGMMLKDESISGATIQYIARQVNQPR